LETILVKLHDVFLLQADIYRYFRAELKHFAAFKYFLPISF